MNPFSNFLLAALCGALLLAGCSGSATPTGRADLEAEFQSEFGIPPPVSVTDIHCKIVRVGDTWGKWMSFTLDEPSLQQIVSRGFSAASAEQLKHSLGSHWQQDLNEENPNAPTWWRTPGAHPGRVYYREPNRKDFAGSSMYIWIDESAKLVYSHSSGWD